MAPAVESKLSIGALESTALRPSFGSLTANGASAVEQVLTLPGNAIVGSFPVTVWAGRSEWTLCQAVGQLRQQDTSSGTQASTSVVVDFGTLRTVSGVGLQRLPSLQGSFRILQVRQWTGTGFAKDPVETSLPGMQMADLLIDRRQRSPAASFNTLPFSSQIRTERLQIDLLGKTDDATLGRLLLAQLPDLPADFELRINGGPPVWTSLGPVTDAAPGWIQPPAGTSGPAHQEVDLGAAINALLGDPAADITPAMDLHVVFSARVPGVLRLDLPPDIDSRVRYLAQVALPPGQDELTFTAEGLKTVPLPLPSWVQSVEDLDLTVTAKLPPERTVPPLGPDAQPVETGSSVPLAEMELDPERSAAVALGGQPLGELIGVRLPLRAGASGAEVVALLLAGGADRPGAPLDGGASKPASLQATDGDVWTTFPFPRPVPLDPAGLPYVAVQVTRGRVRWSLTGDAAAGQVLFGPPDGPWQPLPALGDLSALRGRVRMMGHAAPDRPVAPLQIGLAGGAVRTAVTPSPKGVAVEVAGPVDSVAPPALEIVSLTAGTVTLSRLVVTATRKAAT